MDVYEILIGKPYGNTSRWCIYGNNIKIVLKSMYLDHVNWIHLALDREQWLVLIH
jgi:hypothetical protein